MHRITGLALAVAVCLAVSASLLYGGSNPICIYLTGGGNAANANASWAAYEFCRSRDGKCTDYIYRLVNGAKCR